MPHSCGAGPQKRRYCLCTVANRNDPNSIASRLAVGNDKDETSFPQDSAEISKKYPSLPEVSYYLSKINVNHSAAESVQPSEHKS